MLGVLLTGVVFIQVEVLKLGASIGRSMNLATELQSRNQLLRADVSRLSDDGRIERLAASMGMVMPEPTELKFVAPSAPGGLHKAVDAIQPPDADSFLSNLATEQQADGAPPATTVATASTDVTPASSVASDATAGSADASPSADTGEDTSAASADADATAGATGGDTAQPTEPATSPGADTGAAAPTGTAGSAPVAAAPPPQSSGDGAVAP